MASHDIVVLGASAGGVEALSQLVSTLPRDLPAAIFVTMHIAPQTSSVLPLILERAGKLPALHPKQGEVIRQSRIYVAPPNRHLLMRQGRIVLSLGPKENGTRPAIDPMFRAAAREYGHRVIGAVLSGALDDGTAGLGAIRARKGITAAQSPDTALFPSMPQSAIAARAADRVLDIPSIGALIAAECRRSAAEPEPPVSGSLIKEMEMAEFNPEDFEEAERPGVSSMFTCPDCGGVLRLIEGEDDPAHFRCQVGHAWGPHALEAAQVEKVEESLWAALRVLDEHTKLTERLLADARRRNLTTLIEHFEERLRDLRASATKIRDVILTPAPQDVPAPGA